MGGGGCTAVALSKLFRCSKEVAVRRLDAMIPHVATHVRADVRSEGYVGVPGEAWCVDVVKRVVVAAGFDFRIVPVNAELPALLADEGSFLIDGLLNKSFVKVVNRREERHENAPEDSTTPWEAPERWRHTIAVRNGRILEEWGWMNVRVLWLRANGTPDDARGYMYRVHRVYRLAPRVAR